MDSLHVYLNVILEFECSPPEIEESVFKGLVTLALKQLHGDIGAAMMIDLIMYNADCLQGVLRVHQRDLKKLWSALTLYGFYENQRCAFIVRQESSDFIPPKVENQHSNSEPVSGCG